MLYVKTMPYLSNLNYSLSVSSSFTAISVMKRKNMFSPNSFSAAVPVSVQTSAKPFMDSQRQTSAKKCAFLSKRQVKPLIGSNSSMKAVISMKKALIAYSLIVYNF